MNRSLTSKTPAAVMKRSWLSSGMAVCFWLGLATAVHAQVLVPIPGSPFLFFPPEAGDNSEVVLLSPDEEHLFVATPFSANITVLDVGSDGVLTSRGAFPTVPANFPSGMATNPAGDRLYVTTSGSTVNVHSVDSDGSLTQIQAAPLDTPSSALNGIVYVSRPGGDFVYVNNDAVPNTVSAFSVNLDGTLTLLASVPTGGNGGGGGFFSAPTARAIGASGGRLFVTNGTIFGGSNNISVFEIQADGSLVAVPGSPFPLPADSFLSGGMAVDPGAAFLYAGTQAGSIVKFSIEADGSLSPIGSFPTGVFGRVDGLEVHPAGAFLVAAYPESNQIAVVETATMTPAPFSPAPGDGVPVSVDFNNGGTRLFVANCCSGTRVGVYEFGPPPPPPANDDFANAAVIPRLPFNDSVDTRFASRESGEPTPSCASDPRGSVWYAFTPTERGSVSASVSAPFSAVVAAYTGNSLASLTQVGCGNPFGGLLTFHVDAGTTYYFQASGVFGQNGVLQFRLAVAPPPVANFFFSPFDPSVFDSIQFFDNSFDPGQVGIQSEAWEFGDGTSGTGCCPSHRYAADADYTAQLTVTTFDGRTASASQVVHVKTHDVAITKFTVPTAASAGQTRHLTVGMSNGRYPETVEVQLLKSVPGSFNNFQLVGTLTQFVPVGPGGRTIPFDFTYTFTSDDAVVGKVTFEAVATIMGARDAQSADNAAIALPTKVNR